MSTEEGFTGIACDPYVALKATNYDEIYYLLDIISLIVLLSQ